MNASHEDAINGSMRIRNVAVATTTLDVPVTSLSNSTWTIRGYLSVTPDGSRLVTIQWERQVRAMKPQSVPLVLRSNVSPQAQARMLGMPAWQSR